MKLNCLFQDGAVFQRNKMIPVWGKGEPSHKIKAVFGGKTAFTLSNTVGNFRLYLPPFEAGGPFTLEVTDTENGDCVVVKDILVGEVWVASGQSNMSYLMGSDWANSNQPREQKTSFRQLKEFKETPFDASICRFFSVPEKATGRLESEVQSAWHSMDAAHVADCSAVAAWFGRFLCDELQVPVGMLVSAWGGTICEAWTSEEALLTNPDTAWLVDQVRSREATEISWEAAAPDKKYEELTQTDPGNQGVEWGWAKPDFCDDGWQAMTIPGSWMMQKIAGNGAVWIRKKVTLPASWEGKELVLETGGIDKHDITYFNGVEVGRTGKDFEEQYWHTPRQYAIPGNLVHAGVNTIAIRAFSFLFDGAFLGGEDSYRLVLAGTEEAVTFTGICRARAEFDWGVLKTPSQMVALGAGNPNTPGILFNAMLNPLIPYAIRGAIWYQGESNTRDRKDAMQYLGKMKTMINDWRFRWGQGNFPFIQVQLANWFDKCDYNPEDHWTVLREAQRVLCNEMENVSMISAIDIGELEDIHPQDKKTVGRRLADNALHSTYGRCSIPMGPMFRSWQREGNAIRVFFDYAEGLYADADAARSFRIFATGGEVYVPDMVRVEGTTLVVASSECAMPAALVYAWSRFPGVTGLRNGAGLPASPFSTRYLW